MKRCSLTTVRLSQTALVFIIASAVYLVLTRFIDTPFAKSLSNAQKKLKTKESIKRGKIFVAGLLVGIVTIVVCRPFKKG